MKKVLLYILIIVIYSYGIAMPINSLADYSTSYSDAYDVYGHWAERDIDILMDLGILKGNGDFAVNPQKNITRAEFTALLIRTIAPNEQTPLGSSFDDVKPTDWFFDVTAQAKAIGLIMGFDGQFRPFDSITREEIMLIISRLDFVKGNANVNFSDIPSNYPYLKNLSNAIGSGIINGYENNTFKPKATATRAECSAIIRRLIDAMQPEKPTNAQIEEIKADVTAYLNSIYSSKNNSSDLEYNLALSTGRELENNRLRVNLAKLIESEGITINNSISGMTFDTLEVSNAIICFKVSYSLNIKRTSSNGEVLSRNYNVSTSIDLINKGGAWKVFANSESLARQERTSLVWDYIHSQSPDLLKASAMNGLDVISPTWYELGQNDANIKAIPDSKYVKDAHDKGYEVWPLVKNAFGAYSTDNFLKNSSARSQGIDELFKAVLSYKLDGLNVDFENMDVSNKPYFSTFVSELTFVMHYIGVPVSVDVSKYEATSRNWSLCYDRTALGKYADYVMLMAYDQNGSFSSKAGSVAQLSWVENAVNLTLKEVPAQKLLLGIPFYTRVWESQNDKVASTKAISMQDAKDLISSNNAQLVWDATSGQTVATWYKGDSKYNIWLENAYSISLKAKLVDKYDLAGTAAWRRGFETDDVWEVIGGS